ncbi:phosphoinositide-3-kinase-interacting protein 1 isoform X1 [Pristis pectinata]|uniref:phosphoinositide-3-kinase-interacting protein 1 isoform X1 n=1 Tax=Pristis pectinata TaxID=685728 RepID=UPI00223CECE5|nr:phosphoinositide-3-kinase-interacting protein 1 isoform X1 [Pristis pectinata]
MEAGGGAGPRGSGGGGGRGLPGLGRVALLLHLLTVVGAAPRPECITSNGTDLTGEQRITSGVNCANLMQSEQDYNLTLSQNITGASLSEDVNHTTGEAETVKPGVSAAQVNDQVKLPSASEPDIQQPVGGISHPVRQSAEPKRDLGVPGQVLAIIMIAIIIVLGCGITLGYIYKRGRDLKKQREQQACEQEIQRIMLPLSAFSNPSCELDDEITLVMVTPQTHAGGSSEGDCPLAAAAGTPGA